MEAHNNTSEVSEDFSNIQQDLYNQKQIAIENGDYILADRIMKKIKELEKNIKTKNKKNVIATHRQNLDNLEAAYCRDIENFNKIWDEKENQLAEQLENKERILNQKHKAEIDNLYKKFNDNPNLNNYKPSSKYLDLKKSEEELVKQDRFLEANQIKLQIENLIKQEIENQKFILTGKINKTVEKIVEKQNNEKNAFQKDAKFQFETLNKAKERELSKINVKYKSQRAEIEKIFKMSGFSKESTNQIESKMIRNSKIINF